MCEGWVFVRRALRFLIIPFNKLTTPKYANYEPECRSPYILLLLSTVHTLPRLRKSERYITWSVSTPMFGTLLQQLKIPKTFIHAILLVAFVFTGFTL